MHRRTTRLLQPDSGIKRVLRLSVRDLHLIQRQCSLQLGACWTLHAVHRLSDALVVFYDSTVWFSELQQWFRHDMRFGYILHRVDVCDSASRVLQPVHVPRLVLSLSSW